MTNSTRTSARAPKAARKAKPKKGLIRRHPVASAGVLAAGVGLALLGKRLAKGRRAKAGAEASVLPVRLGRRGASKTRRAHSAEA